MQLDSLVAEHKLQRQIVQGQPFRHLLLSNSSSVDNAHQLHVYIEGDGLPWLSSRIVSADPTPRNPLALRLMVQDHNPAVYLGRPCYFEMVTDKGCSPLLWTHQRYSAQVVDSLVFALRGYLKSKPNTKLSLIGYSGGGVLAMLMASRLAETEQVITVAANLAVGEWAELHGFTELYGSLDPMQQAPLPNSIRQLHLLGERDKNVPPELTRLAIERQAPWITQVIIRPGFDHRCCWVEAWPDVISLMNAP